MTIRNIAVIGAGAAGLAAIRELAAAGHKITCYERRDIVGGHWNADYDALHLITPKSASNFRDYFQPEDYPPYPSRDQVVAYLHRFAEDQDLVRHIHFGTEVVDVRPRGGSRGTGGWTVTLADETEQHFDAVVVANGHLHQPYIPELPGSFAGKIIHSVDYHNVGDIGGHRVLVVGAGNSGCDLAVDAAQSRLDVSISIRHGFVFMPKSLLGKPRAELFINKLPRRMYALALRWLVQVSVGRPEQYPGFGEGLDVTYRHHDVTSQRDWADLVEHIAARHGTLDVLVNNAGIVHTCDLAEEDLHRFETVMRVNATGVFLGMKSCWDLLKSTGEGAIVNIASVYGQRSNPGYVAYTASKAAVIGMTRTAAIEGADVGIRANVVSPGTVQTSQLKDEGKSYVRDATPMDRGADSSEISRTVAFLASADASFVTGAELIVDGGFSAH